LNILSLDVDADVGRQSIKRFHREVKVIRVADAVEGVVDLGVQVVVFCASFEVSNCVLVEEPIERDVFLNGHVLDHFPCEELGVIS